MKLYFVGLLFAFFAFVPSLFASTISWESDAGDYIGGGKSITFDTAQGDKISSLDASSNTVKFSFSSFSISGMGAEFSSENGHALTEKGKFYPAKRNAFRDSYNGIDVSGNGRGCNEILGGFYVHEFNIENGVLKSAAIDFVQYCEKNTSIGLYGSIRYNSSIPSNCLNGTCKKVKDLFGIISSVSSSSGQKSNNSSSNSTTTIDLFTEFEDNANELVAKLSEEFPFFFENCSIDMLGSEKGFISACGEEFKNDMKKAKSSMLLKSVQANKLTKGKKGAERFKASLQGIKQVLAALRSDRKKIKNMDNHKNIQTAAPIIMFEMLKLTTELVAKIK